MTHPQKLKVLHALVVVIIATTLLLSYLGIFKPITIGSSERQNYRDLEYSISFDYPNDFDSRIINDLNGRIVGVSPKILENQSDPRVIEVAYEKDLNPDKSLQDTIFTLFPNLKRSDLKQVASRKIEGFEFSIYDRDTTSIYSYYKANGNMYLIKFEESYYETDNALVPINNRLYLGAYYEILNSLKLEN